MTENNNNSKHVSIRWLIIILGVIAGLTSLLFSFVVSAQQRTDDRQDGHVTQLRQDLIKLFEGQEKLNRDFLGDLGAIKQALGIK